MIDESKLRKHQKDALERARAIVRGEVTGKVTVASVTPGGGKTKLASVFANELFDRKYIEQVVVLVPRNSLRRQMTDGFPDPECGLHIRLSAGVSQTLGQAQCFDRGGVVTTYQANIHNVKRLMKRLQGRRFLLVLDEPHHLSDADKAQWKLGVQPLFDAARHVLMMSGTINRHDRWPVAFVPYGEDKKPIVNISYSRREALTEHAVLRVSLKLYESNTRYWHLHKERAVQLSKANGQEAPKALRSALEDSTYVEYALSDAISEWQGYRQKMYGSRAIVICHKQSHAKMAATFLREKFGLRSTLAISEEPDAPDALRKFRERSGDAGDVLITVLMASEGFDAPDCTHLICLTNIRSRPWLDQALARVTRMNTKCGLPWKQQFAFIYAPNDPEMVSYLDAALDDQVLLATTEPGEVGVSAGDRFKSTFVPIEGLPGGHSYGDTERRYHDHENRLVDRVKAAAPSFASHPAHDLLQLAKLIWPHEFSPEAAE